MRGARVRRAPSPARRARRGRAHLVQELLERADCRQVEVVCRLVEDEHVWRAREHGEQLQPPALAAAQPADERAPLVLREGEEIQQPARRRLSAAAAARAVTTRRATRRVERRRRVAATCGRERAAHAARVVDTPRDKGEDAHCERVGRATRQRRHARRHHACALARRGSGRRRRRSRRVRDAIEAALVVIPKADGRPNDPLTGLQRELASDGAEQ